ncbi:MAG: hypothetical protein Q8R49_05680 [Rhodoferax sp.]|nr:hypothetical protein [Rhodoferax sp.]
MDKTDPPETFGVFKPVGHTVVTFRSDQDLQAAMSALLEQRFPTSALARYSPEEMKALVDAELENAGSLASFGYELDLIKIHRTHAREGCSFLIVHAPDDEQAQCVAAVARATHAIAAQHYGTFMIEELSGMASADTPMASPA